MYINHKLYCTVISSETIYDASGKDELTTLIP